MKKYDDTMNYEENEYYMSDLPEEREARPKRKNAFPISTMIFWYVTFGAIIVFIILVFTVHTSGIKPLLCVYGLTAMICSILNCYKKINTHFTLVTKCSQLINAQCVSVTPVEWNGKGGYIYHPIYRYIWNGVKYSAAAGKTESKRMRGEVYPIMINPSDPNMIYDPFIKRKKTAFVIFEAVMQVILPLAAFVVLFLIF